MGDYNKKLWVDHILDQNNNVVQQGTPVSAGNLNNMEDGINLASNLVGMLVVAALQEIEALKWENKLLSNQKILQGTATITGVGSQYFTSAYPSTAVSIPAGTFPQSNAPNYQVILDVTSADDMGAIGVLSVINKSQNGFAIQYTGSAKQVTVLWTIVNPTVK